MAVDVKTFTVPNWSGERSRHTVKVRVLRNNFFNSPRWDFQVEHQDGDEALSAFVADINLGMNPGDLAGLEGIKKLVERYSVPWRPRVKIDFHVSEPHQKVEETDCLLRIIEVICEWASKKLALAPDLAQPTA